MTEADNATSVLQRLYTGGFTPDLKLVTPTKEFLAHKSIVGKIFDQHPSFLAIDASVVVISVADIDADTLDALLQDVYGLPVACLQAKDNHTAEDVIKILKVNNAAFRYDRVELYDATGTALIEIFHKLKSTSQLLDIGVWMTGNDFSTASIYDELLSAIIDRTEEITSEEELWNKLRTCAELEKEVMRFLASKR